MMDGGTGIVVGVLGQWASGKSTAAGTLVSYLGGEGEVEFISDRALLAGQVVKHILELDDSRIQLSVEEDGTRRLEGEQGTVWLDPDQTLTSVDLDAVRFDFLDNPASDVEPAWHGWFNRARVELGYRILEKAGGGKPVVAEAGFGTDTEAGAEYTLSHSVSDLFARLGEAGLEPRQVRWMIIQAGYRIRSDRNRARPVKPPASLFDRYAADGGDLDPEEQKRLEQRGTVVKRVSNNHDDIERFRADVIAAFEEMFGDQLPARIG